MHIIKRQSLAGKAIIRSNNALLESSVAINMALDVLAERGYDAVLDACLAQDPDSCVRAARSSRARALG